MSNEFPVFKHSLSFYSVNNIHLWLSKVKVPALIEGARTILSENRSSVSEVDIKEAIEFQEERINALEGRRIIDVEAN